MAVVLVVALIVLIAYTLGSIPFGLLVARYHGIDIREHGSRNIGATNVWRVLGRKAGLPTFLLDTAKGTVAVLIGMKLGTHLPGGQALAHGAADVRAYAGIAAALGCIAGHNFPVWLRFKGGKGVATSMGVILGMMPLASLLTFGIWAIMVKVTGYVSLASIIAAACLPVVVLALLFTPLLEGWAFFYFALAAAIMVIVRHRVNIVRLVHGTEHRFGTPEAVGTVDLTPGEDNRG